MSESPLANLDPREFIRRTAAESGADPDQAVRNYDQHMAEKDKLNSPPGKTRSQREEEIEKMNAEERKKHRLQKLTEWILGKKENLGDDKE